MCSVCMSTYIETMLFRLHTICTLLLIELEHLLVSVFGSHIYAFRFDGFGIDFWYSVCYCLCTLLACALCALNILVECCIPYEFIWSFSLCYWYIHFTYSIWHSNWFVCRANFRTIDKCRFARAVHWSILHRWFWISVYFDMGLTSHIQ